jgi:hypothetical protein
MRHRCRQGGNATAVRDSVLANVDSAPKSASPSADQRRQPITPLTLAVINGSAEVVDLL